MGVSPYVKQAFVAIAPFLAAMSMGGTLGYPCVLLLQLMSKESTIKTDYETLSWIASMHGLAGFGSTLMPTIMQLKGRRFSFIASAVLLLIGWILAFVAKDINTLVLSSALQGLSSNCIAIINLVTVSEMLAPKIRPASMILISVNQTLGMVLASILGVWLSWRTVAFIMCGPVVISICMVAAWPESPSWLACKGKFEEAKQSFTWLRGTDDEAAIELQALIASQMETKFRKSDESKIRQLYYQLKRKDFYIPTLHMFLILFNLYSGGGIAIFIYSKDILGTAIGDSQIAVTGFVLSVCLLLTGSFISLILIRYFNTKTVLFTSFGCVICLILCSSVLYLQSIGVIQKESLLFLYFFSGFMLFNNSGFNSVTYILAIELMPVKHRGVGGAIFNVLTCLLYLITVKSLPFIISSITIFWTFLLFAVCSFICTMLIMIYVPETKNRTLQEIEDYYNYGRFVTGRHLDEIEANMPMVKSS